MEDYTLISIEEMKNLTSVSDNIDVEQLLPFLYNSQEMYIRPVLGDALMDNVITSMESGGTKYESLVQNYIYYPLSYACWFSAAPFLHMKTHKKGVVKQSSDNSENVSIDEWGVYSQRIENTMTFYLRRLKEYLDTDAAKLLYPLYCSTDQISPQSSSSIFLGF